MIPMETKVSCDEEVITLQELKDIQKKLGVTLYEATLAFERACQFHGTTPRLTKEASDALENFLFVFCSHRANEERGE